MRFFTPEEANEALAAVRPVVERLVEARRSLARIEPGLARVRGAVSGNGGGLDPSRVAELEVDAGRAAAALHALVEELEGMGVQVKDLDAGLVDFPAVHPDDGSTVLLCWHLGEAEIAYWHTLEGGFAGRKPLPF